MALSRKGVFFTFTALIFLSLLIFSSSVTTVYEMRERNFVLETRIDASSRFLTDIEQDVIRAAYIAGYRSFIGISNQILLDGEYILDVDSAFEELFLNGTINGTNSTLMTNNTFPTWIDRITEEAEKLDLTANLTVHNIAISQDDPWNVKVSMNMTITLIDQENISQWHKEDIITSYIDIEGFSDPVYLIETGGLVERQIERSPFVGSFTSGADISNLLNNTYEGYFVNDADAPSYLQRLEGQIDSSSPYGIESLVDIAELINNGVSVDDKTIVDHGYFGSSNPAADHVSGAPSWFKIDVDHQADYQVTGLV